MRRARRAGRRLAATLAGPRPNRYTAANGTIASVTANAAADGNSAVTVTVLGSTIAAPYLESYTPTVGDMVRVEFTNGSPLILGAVIGLPSF